MIAMTRRLLLPVFVCLAFVGCGPTPPPSPDAGTDAGLSPVPGDDAGVPDAGMTPCRRYQERLDGVCVAVTVTGIETRALSFTRDGYTLHGTLTLPVTEGEYLPPVFVLAHGSGPSDRDETATGSLGIGYGQAIPTFKLLAEGLTQAGAAVYRYDKRTCFRENSDGRCPTSIDDYPGDLADILVDDFILDFRAAVRAVAALPEVDGEDITVVGHSQGANFVPLLMVDEPGVIAGVQLAGGSLPIDQAVPGQLRDLADFLEGLGAQYAQQAAALRAEAARMEADLQQIRAGTFPDPEWEGATVEFWRNWMARTDNLEAEFLAVEAPILLLGGTMDFNVAPHHLQRFEGWATAAGKDNAAFVLLPDVTHGFVTVINGGTAIDPRFSPAGLEAIIDWHQGLSP